MGAAAPLHRARGRRRPRAGPIPGRRLADHGLDAPGLGHLVTHGRGRRRPRGADPGRSPGRSPPRRGHPRGAGRRGRHRRCLRPAAHHCDAGGAVRPRGQHPHAAPHRRSPGGPRDLRRRRVRRRAVRAGGARAHAGAGGPCRRRRAALAGGGRGGRAGRRRRGDRLPRGREAPVVAAGRVAPATPGGERRRVAGGDRQGVAAPGRDARPLLDPGARHRHGVGPARDTLRASTRARHQGEPCGLAQGRPRLRAGGDGRARSGAHPRQAGRRRRGAQHPGQLRVARRHPRAVPAARLAHGLLAGQGRHRQGRACRPREDGPSAHRRHHRLGQERLPERPHQLHPAARHAGRGAHDHDRPQEGGAQQLQRRAAPAGARWSPT